MHSNIFSIFGKRTTAPALAVATVLVLSVRCHATVATITCTPDDLLALASTGKEEFKVRNIPYYTKEGAAEIRETLQDAGAIAYIEGNEHEAFTAQMKAIVDELYKRQSRHNDELYTKLEQRMQTELKKHERTLEQAISKATKISTKDMMGKITEVGDVVKNDVKDVKDTLISVREKMEKIEQAPVEIEVSDDDEQGDRSECCRIAAKMLVVTGIAIVNRAIDTIPLPVASATLAVAVGQYFVVTTVVGGAFVTYFILMDACGKTNLPCVDPRDKRCCGFPVIKAVFKKAAQGCCCCCPGVNTTWEEWRKGLGDNCGKFFACLKPKCLDFSCCWTTTNSNTDATGTGSGSAGPPAGSISTTPPGSTASPTHNVSAASRFTGMVRRRVLQRIMDRIHA